MSNTFISMLIVLVPFLSVTSALGQIIGDPAPDFQCKKILQAPADAPISLSKLKGSFVILEFWATWCAPCRTALKKYSDLAERFVDKPIRFLAVSREKQEDIEKYIKSNPSKLWIGIDSSGEAFEKYDVETLPYTLVIDKQGLILAITTAKEITEEHLKGLLAGNPVEFEQMLTTKEFLDREYAFVNSIPVPSVRFTGFPQTLGKSIPEDFISINSNQNILTAVTILPLLIREAFQIQPYQEKKMTPTSLISERFFVNIHLPESSNQALRDTLKNIIMRSLNLEVQITKEKKEVYVLQRKNGSPEPLLSDAKKSEFRYDRTQVTAVKQPITSLLRYLNTFKKVVDETRLNGEYDLSFSWDITKKYGLEEGLASLGLEIVKKEREIDMYSFTQKSSSPSN
jgi:uncharacterized protein (TIGR03435 family)